jgi:hypothetical protein
MRSDDFVGTTPIMLRLMEVERAWSVGLVLLIDEKSLLAVPLTDGLLGRKPECYVHTSWGALKPSNGIVQLLVINIVPTTRSWFFKAFSFRFHQMIDAQGCASAVFLRA